MLQKELSAYYEQKLYLSAISSARKRFRKASNIAFSRLRINENKLINDYISGELFSLEMLVCYFTLGYDFRHRLVGKSATNYLNSSYFRKLFTSIYLASNDPAILEEALSARITAPVKEHSFQEYKNNAKKPIDIYSLRNSITGNNVNTEVIIADAVASALQHTMLLLENGI